MEKIMKSVSGVVVAGVLALTGRALYLKGKSDAIAELKEKEENEEVEVLEELEADIY